jgi:CDP-diacylglycerol--serine O-phosphatidyltransferase
MDTAPTTPSKKPPRGIYLLPNLFTTGGMFAGFYAIISAINGRFEEAAIAVFVAGLLDGVDGRVARMTNTQSEFGVQFDSLADLVSFGLAPALVMYMWALEDLKTVSALLGKAGWAAAFLYAACAAVRLARFNTQVGTVDKRYFIGLASPAAAGFMMSFVWTMETLGVSAWRAAPWALGATVLAAVLMVSRIRYWSFKSAPASDRLPFSGVPILIGVFVLLTIDPPRVLLAVAVIYLVSGPLTAALGWLRRRRGDGAA